MKDFFLSFIPQWKFCGAASMPLPAKKVGSCSKDLLPPSVMMAHKYGEIIDRESKIMHP